MEILTTSEKNFFMNEALTEAKKAEKLGEVPIGAVVVYQKQIIARGYNLREKTQKATAHAEILAINEACTFLNSWRLEETRLFVTLEPCSMCSGAMLLARIPEVYYGAKDPKGGAAGTLINLLADSRFNHVAKTESGVLEEPCSQILTNFFKQLRKKRKNSQKG